MWVLLDHLSAGMLATQENASCINLHCQIERRVFGLIHRYGSPSTFRGYPGIVDHTSSIDQPPQFVCQRLCLTCQVFRIAVQLSQLDFAHLGCPSRHI